jgi:beta-lactamase regulating signal transducer with metallopeptidase domain
MQPLAHLLAAISAIAAGSLIAAIWQGTILAACVALCLRVFKGVTPGVRSLLWTGVLLLVALLHFSPLLHLAAPPNRVSGAVRTFHVDLRWSLAIAAAWALLSLLRGIQLLHGALALRRTARRAAPVVASPECAALLRTRLRRAELCTSADVDRPSVIGFFAPRILIPRDLYEKIAPSELEQIVMHEMEHLRRADDWTNLLQKLSLMLFPLNPVLLFVERRLCLERELACDDRVLQLTHARKAYATCLVNLAEHSVLRRGAALALGAWERQSELARRVHRILTQPEGGMASRRMRFAAAALMVAMAGGAATLAREPQLVSFVAPAPAETALLQASGKIPASEGYGPQRQSARMTAASAAQGPLASLRAAQVPVSSGTRMTQPHMVDTVFHQPAQQTVKSARPRPRPRPSARPVRNAVASPRTNPSRRAPQARALLVLTSWSDSPQPSPLKLVVSDGVSYAAVATPSGWLVFQL